MKLFAIDREMLVKNGSELLRTSELLRCLVPLNEKEECLHHHIESGRCVRGCFDGDKQDTRCTKCNGKGEKYKGGWKTELTSEECTQCNGTGKEPRKALTKAEVNIVHEECDLIKNELKAKLHIATEALKKIENLGLNENNEYSIIARYALEKLKQKPDVRLHSEEDVNKKDTSIMHTEECWKNNKELCSCIIPVCPPDCACKFTEYKHEQPQVMVCKGDHGGTNSILCRYCDAQIPQSL